MASQAPHHASPPPPPPLVGRDAAQVHPVPMIKSASDDRLYRYITLPGNNLRCVLISDPATDKAAAAMTVQVGHLCDPKEIPGVAHFVEHMCFQGSSEFPGHSSYKKWLSDHGGSSNASTSMDRTSYFFDVTQPHLEATLRRFAGFFTSPLFDAAATKRELNAIDAENAKNILNDSRRLFQLNKNESDPNHVFSKFGTGNKETLETVPQSRSIDVRKVLLDFHKKWYSGSLMRLAVLGREDLDTLQHWVAEMFAGVPATPNGVNVPSFVDDGCPFRPEYDLARSFDIVPVRQLRWIRLSFVMPRVNHWFRTKPCRFLSHIIGHEGSGSLLHTLKKKGLANELSAGTGISLDCFSTFRITIKATEAGMQQRDVVIGLVFSYLNMLRKRLQEESSAGTFQRIYREIWQLSVNRFRFKPKASPRRYVASIAKQMSSYNGRLAPEETLIGSFVGLVCPQDLTQEALDQAKMILFECLVPERLRLFCLHRSFDAAAKSAENEGVGAAVADLPKVRGEMTQDGLVGQFMSASLTPSTFKKSKWYGTKYFSYRISEAKLNAWSKAAIGSDFRLPQTNEFIPSDFSLCCDRQARNSAPHVTNETSADVEYELDSLPAVKPKPPVLLAQDGCNMRVWHHMDTEFRKPKCNVEIAILTDVAYESALASVMARLLCRVIEDALTPFAYDASVASLDFSLFNTSQGLTMSFGGFSHKLGILIRKVATAMRGIIRDGEDDDDGSIVQFDESRFFELLEVVRLSLRNFDKARPQQWCAYNSQLLLNNIRWSIAEKLDCIESGDVTVDVFKQFVGRLLDSCSIRTIFYGNVDENEAISLSKTVQSAMCNSGETRTIQAKAPFKDVLPGRATVLPGPRCNIVHRMGGRDASNENSAVEVMFQIVPPATSARSLPPSFRPHALSLREEAVARLVAHLLKQPCFSQLRTEEQLGYLVSSGYQCLHGVSSIWIMVQSKVRGPSFLDQRVAAFVNDRFRADVLGKMSRETFRSNVLACISKWGEKDKRMSQRSKRFCAALESNLRPFEFNARFYRADALLDALNEGDEAGAGLEKLWDEVVAFVDTYIMKASVLRKRLAFHVVASQHKLEDDKIWNKEGERVVIGEDSMSQFKAGLQLFPQRVSRWLQPNAQQASRQDSWTSRLDQAAAL